MNKSEGLWTESTVRAKGGLGKRMHAVIRVMVMLFDDPESTGMKSTNGNNIWVG